MMRSAERGMLRDRAILLLAVGQTLVWAGLYYVFPAMLLHWEAGLGWARTELTLAFTLAVLASALAAPLAGRVIDRGYGAVQMGLSAALGGMGVALVSQITQAWQFLAVWVFVGVMLAGCLYEPCFALIVRARAGGARRAITLIALVAGFAGTVSFPAVHVLAGMLGWRTAMAAIGLGVAGLVAPLLFLGARALEPARAADAPEPRGPGRRFVRLPVFWYLGLGFAVLALVHGATLHHLLPLLGERGVPAPMAVAAAAAIGPMQVLGRLTMVATERRLSTHACALIAFASMGASAVLLLVAGTSPVLIGASVALFGAAYGTVSILRPVVARDMLGGDGFGAISGGLALLYLASSAISAYLGAVIWQVGGYRLMLALLVALAGIGALLYAAARRCGPD